MTDEDAKAIVHDHKAGMGVCALGRKYHRATSVISRLLERRGAKPMTRSRRRGKRHVLSDEEKNTLAAEYQAGARSWKLAEKYAIDRTTVRRIAASRLARQVDSAVVPAPEPVLDEAPADGPEEHENERGDKTELDSREVAQVKRAYYAPRRRNVGPGMVAQIKRLYLRGVRPTAIAQQLGVTTGSVYYHTQAERGADYKHKNRRRTPEALADFGVVNAALDQSGLDNEALKAIVRQLIACARASQIARVNVDVMNGSAVIEHITVDRITL